MMIEQNAFTIIFAIFTLFTVKDVFYGQAGTQPSVDPINSHIPNDDHIHSHHIGGSGGPSIINGISEHQSNIAAGTGLHTLKVQYCHSCGYRQAFEDIRARLKSDFPSLIIEGEISKPGFIRSQIANLVFLAKIGFFVMVYARFNPFAYFHLETPGVWHFVTENRMAASVMALLLTSSIESNMMSTGAFEVFLNDIPIWSKIQSGRLPPYPELSRAITSHMYIGKSKYHF